MFAAPQQPALRTRYADARLCFVGDTFIKPENSMAAPSSQVPSQRPRRTYRNLGPGELARYRMPLPALVSILHRISGALLFFMTWLLLWLLQASATNAAQFRELYANPLVKLV